MLNWSVVRLDQRASRRLGHWDSSKPGAVRTVRFGNRSQTESRLESSVFPRLDMVRRSPDLCLIRRTRRVQGSLRFKDYRALRVSLNAHSEASSLFQSSPRAHERLLRQVPSIWLSFLRGVFCRFLTHRSELSAMICDIPRTGIKPGS